MSCNSNRITKASRATKARKQAALALVDEVKIRSVDPAFMGGFLDTYSVRFEVASDTIEGPGDLAYNQGHYRFTAVSKERGAPGVADEGKFIGILKKQPDGS